MKKQLLFLFVLALATAASAQTQVRLQLNHRMGEENFQMGTNTSNNLGNIFNFSRVEYYVSGISLLHDGGQEISFPDLYYLVDPSEAFLVDMGNLAITQLEAIRFHVGVDEGRNHSDPATYPSSHPLAPKSPSMHWGWTSGYRFIALEGNGGNTMTRIWEIHGLEDANYFQTEIPLALTASNNELLIDLKADYARAMENINTDAGPIVHGGFGEAIVALRNFQNLVFSVVNSPTSTSSIADDSRFVVYPNPVGKNQTVRFSVGSSGDLSYDLVVTDALGRVQQRLNSILGNTTKELVLPQAGLYFLQVQLEGKTIRTERLVVE